MTPWCRCIACWVAMLHTQSQYKITFFFSTVTTVARCASMLHYTNIACLAVKAEEAKSRGPFAMVYVDLWYNLVSCDKRYFGCTDATKEMAARVLRNNDLTTNSVFSLLLHKIAENSDQMAGFRTFLMPTDVWPQMYIQLREQQWQCLHVHLLYLIEYRSVL
jgi:hypothetical protein